MVGTTESLGRLIAEEVLLHSDRQLLRNRDQPGQQSPHDMPTTEAAPASAPLTHNDKTVASVLLTLLDEQLDASSHRSEMPGDLAALQAIGEEKAAAPNSVVARYAEEDAVFRPDPPQPQATPTPNLTNQQILLAASSPELRMAMQNAFFSATVRAAQSAEPAGASTRNRQLQTGNVANSPTLIRVGAGIVVIAALAILLAIRFTG